MTRNNQRVIPLIFAGLIVLLAMMIPAVNFLAQGQDPQNDATRYKNNTNNIEARGLFGALELAITKDDDLANAKSCKLDDVYPCPNTTPTETPTEEVTPETPEPATEDTTEEVTPDTVTPVVPVVPVVQPTTPAPDPCAEHGGLQWQGETCVCAGVKVYITMCEDGLKIEDMTTEKCDPPPNACSADNVDGGGSGGDGSGGGGGGGDDRPGYCDNFPDAPGC